MADIILRRVSKSKSTANIDEISETGATAATVAENARRVYIAKVEPKFRVMVVLFFGL